MHVCHRTHVVDDKCDLSDKEFKVSTSVERKMFRANALYKLEKKKERRDFKFKKRDSSNDGHNIVFSFLDTKNSLKYESKQDPSLNSIRTTIIKGKSEREREKERDASLLSFAF